MYGNYNDWFFCNNHLNGKISPDEWWIRLFDIVKSTHQSNIFYDNPHEHHFHTDENLYLPSFDELLKKHNKKFYITLSGRKKSKHYIELFSKMKNIEFFIIPTFHLHFLYDNQKVEIPEKINEIQSIERFETLFISLNNQYKNHKFLLVDNLIKNSLNEYGTITYHDDETNNWKNIIKKIDQGWLKSGLLNLSNYKKPLIDLVSESEFDHIRITEKTWKPLILGQLFIVNGGQYFHKYLEEMGFSLYHKIFDYSFDEEPDVEIRIEGIMKNLNRLKKMNYQDLYRSCINEIKHNQNRTNEILEHYEFVPIRYLELINFFISIGEEKEIDIFDKHQVFNILHSK